MRRALLFVCSLLSAVLSSMAQRFPHFAPVNPNATAEARTLLERLYTTVDEGHIMSGRHPRLWCQLASQLLAAKENGR